MDKQRVYSGLLILGACILIIRAVTMIFEGALFILQPWAGFLLVLEFAISVGVILTSAKWFIKNNKNYSKRPLMLAAEVVIIHAIRVLIFVLGRVVLINFDVRPEYVASHATRWTWFGVIFAAVMSAISIVVLVIIWKKIKENKKRKK